MTKKKVLFIGLMLFSLFFGAGNLIFPPLLGLESGNDFAPAISGFLITGVLLPFIAVLAVAITDGGLVSIGSRVHHVFGIAFAIIVYLSIGAFYGIPRAASVAYELGFQQVFHSEGQLAIILFSFVFFALTFVICLNPKKIVDRVGQILTPILLIMLAILFVRAFFILDNPVLPAAEKYESTPFVSGFLEGYFTMDAIAALAFGIVVVNALKDSGLKTKAEQVKGTLWAGIIAGIGLGVVYLALGWIGSVIPKETTYENGAHILTVASRLLFGTTGSFIFGIIVILACITTCVGLINACARFFHELYSKISYKTYVTIFVIVGFSVSSLGLSVILDIAVPILVFTYPIAIVLVGLSLMEKVVGKSNTMYRLAVLFTFVYAIYDVLTSFELSVEAMGNLLDFAPFFDYGLGWVLPAIVGGVIGYVFDKLRVTEGQVVHEGVQNK